MLQSATRLFRFSALPALALAAGLAVGAVPARAFDFEDVGALARELAAKPYQAAAEAVFPEGLRGLDYDQYRDIRFNPAHARWRDLGLPFELMFFHLGRGQTVPVRLHELSGEAVLGVDYDPLDFDFGHNTVDPAALKGLGLAGFRVHAALNGGAYKDELAVFLGASYFRALGTGQRYGLSARGLAVDTVGGQGEEFPRFTEFWIERPQAQAGRLVLFALLDSRRVAGAYRFEFAPGAQTLVDVRTRLYLREPVATLGIAPLSSMYQHGANQPRPGDFRPAVHDSEGLMLALGDTAGGTEWLWRPLVNPAHPLVSSFQAPALRGFGLMQRDRRYASFEDAEARYELRPSVWIEPLGAWGPGRVELLQFHTADETNDNVVAYWVPAEAPAVGQPLDLSYRMHWQGPEGQLPPTGWTVQSRRGHGFVRDLAALDPGEVQFVVDFDGPALRSLQPAAAVQAVAWSGANGRLLERNAYRDDATGAWRMTLRLAREALDQPLELRAFLQSGDRALTETWTALLPPE
jgi:glucans biosynthesis protein